MIICEGVKYLNLKNILKTLKLNESTISTVLGALVIIIVGVLVVNYFRGLDKGATLPSVDTEDLLGTQLPTTHRVAKGEDLWKISEKYYKSGYNWTDIANENNLSAPYAIEVGQELTIPDVEAKISDSEVANKVQQENIDTKDSDTVIAHANKEPISGTTYTVVKGDTLWSISVRAYGDGYRWVEIAKENNLANPDVIHAGNVFVLPR